MPRTEGVGRDFVGGRETLIVLTRNSTEMWNPLDGLSTVNVSFKKLHPEAKMPFYGSKEAAGADLFAVESNTIAPKKRLAVPLGIAIQLPEGFEAQCRSRSGLAVKSGITVLTGTIDSDYRGELYAVLYNSGSDPLHIDPGDRIAQLVVVPVFRASFTQVQELGESDRGAGGFGSTGTN